MKILVSSIVTQVEKYSYYPVTVTFTAGLGLMLAFEVDDDGDALKSR
jgi:hypothetical protein